MSNLQLKIQELKKRAAPLNRSNTIVDQYGELVERESLLDKRVVEGYGCIWGSRNMHGEKFLKGAFAKSIKEMGPGSSSAYQIKFRDEHGRACALFDELIEDEIGLYFRTKPLDDVSWADDVLTQLRSGTLNNFSNGFGFIWDKIEYDEADDSLIVIEARLFEISVVCIPSDMATFAVRSIEELDLLNDDIEEFINALPRKDRLHARRLFSDQHALIIKEPLEQREIALPKDEPRKELIDYNYLLTKI